MQYYTIYFVAHILILATEYSFICLLRPFDIFHHFVLGHIFTFWHYEMFQAQLVYFLPHLRIAISPRNLVLFTGQWY